MECVVFEKDRIRAGFQTGSLKATDEREMVDWRGIEMIWEDNCF
jgi:hypothetical protein